MILTNICICIEHGAALRISLNAHVFRAYSVDPIFNYQRLAKLACARSAVREGVLDFIKFGNGQTQPTKVAENDLEDPAGILRESTPSPPPKGLSLQEFFETLPRPFPESIGDASINEFNAPAWLNLTLQSARGGRLVSSYTPVVDGVRHCWCFPPYLLCILIYRLLHQCTDAYCALKDLEKRELTSLTRNFQSVRTPGPLFAYWPCLKE